MNLESAQSGSEDSQEHDDDSSNVRDEAGIAIRLPDRSVWIVDGEGNGTMQA